LIIKPLGRLCATDEHGYIVNDSDANKIKPPFLDAVQDAVDFYRTFFGAELHSLYIRGTVARGVAIESHSDLDIIVVTRDGFPVEQREQMNEQTTSQVSAKHPCIDGIETVVLPLDHVLDTTTFSMPVFLLKTHSACLLGEDLIPHLPNYRCDSTVARDHLERYSSYLQSAREDLLQSPDDEAEVRDICRWIMKIIVRTGLALVMDREHAYTRDLYPAYQLFIKHYPEKTPDMTRALELAIEPSSEAQVVTDVLTSFGTWMEEQTGEASRA
jgi:uncharacterized protein